jgi:large subunit ribosomal protein L7/L12
MSDQLIERFKTMTLAELTEFNRRFAETFGVTAEPVVRDSPPVVIEEETEEPTEFTVRLEAIGPNKISVIKVVRQLVGLGLKESKDLVESAPVDVLTAVDAATASRTLRALTAEGATVVVDPVAAAHRLTRKEGHTMAELTLTLGAEMRARRREDVQRWKAQGPHDLREAVLAMTQRYGRSEWRTGLAEAGTREVRGYYERAAARQLRAIHRLVDALAGQT